MAPDETEKRPGGHALDRRRQRALEALVNAASVARAAEECGISKRAIFNYLREDTFKCELRARRAEGLQHATSLLANAAGSFVIRIVEVAMDDNPTIALAASRAGLDLLIRATETTDVLERLKALEERLVHGSARFPAEAGMRRRSA